MRQIESTLLIMLVIAFSNCAVLRKEQTSQPALPRNADIWKTQPDCRRKEEMCDPTLGLNCCGQMLCRGIVNPALENFPMKCWNKDEIEGNLFYQLTKCQKNNEPCEPNGGAGKGCCIGQMCRNDKDLLKTDGPKWKCYNWQEVNNKELEFWKKYDKAKQDLYNICFSERSLARSVLRLEPIATPGSLEKEKETELNS